jgi:hypothetical protein
MSGSSLPALVVGGTALMIGSGLAGTAAILDVDIRRVLRRRKPVRAVEREKDLAAGLGVPWRTWLSLRLVTAALALFAGWLTGIWMGAIIFGAVALFGLRFSLSGRAASERLRMERAFLAELRHLRDRMAVGNQSLDTALQEIGLKPGRVLRHVLSPLARGGPVVDNIVECAVRSRSPIVEQACIVLIVARTRNLDALISAIDDVLVPVADAQLAVQEEALVTLAQQRAVTFAMAGLLGFMFATVMRVDAFRAYYASAQGLVVLALALALFLALVSLLGRIVAVPTWTRWDMSAVAELERRPHE